MSVQFGQWNFDGGPIEDFRLTRVNAFLAPFAPDGRTSHRETGMFFLYGAFHTTAESRRERQPYNTPSGLVVVWDGRLDNACDLLRELEVNNPNATDIEIVTAAYECWKFDCFKRFLGDWAITIWDSQERALILARDFVGIRRLHYALSKNGICWSTLLDPLVYLAARRPELSEEYIAGWLSFYPGTELTPYEGIASVRPGSCLIVKDRGTTTRDYWRLDPAKRIRYRSNSTYEEHFRTLFSQSVRRRLRSDLPVAAELSGGMDSSSIVCVADHLITRGAAATPRLDTISYFMETEPHWDERPYFAKVEELRRRVGVHIQIPSEWPFFPRYDTKPFPAEPGSPTSGSRFCTLLHDALTSQNNRVLLSGTGGDEVLGGVPTPIPELADYLVKGRFFVLGKCLVAFALAKRTTVLRLFADTVATFLPFSLRRNSPSYSWLDARFADRHRSALRGYEKRCHFTRGRPSLEQNSMTLDLLSRQLGCAALTSQPPLEKRYPFLDRDLLEFLFAIPRDQLVRPFERRSLQRRSLVGMVPPEILDRRRKAFVARGPLVALGSQWGELMQATQSMRSASLGILSQAAFREALCKAKGGADVSVVGLLRTLRLEAWLQALGPGADSKSTAHAVGSPRNPGGTVSLNGIQPERAEC
jgi:asparagine synthase (glutamine-hydrolysing)